MIRKGFQKGTEIDAQTHQKSMPKLVSKKLRKIINKYVSLKCKPCKYKVKTMFF